MEECSFTGVKSVWGLVGGDRDGYEDMVVRKVSFHDRERALEISWEIDAYIYHGASTYRVM